MTWRKTETDSEKVSAYITALQKTEVSIWHIRSLHLNLNKELLLGIKSDTYLEKNAKTTFQEFKN